MVDQHYAISDYEIDPGPLDQPDDLLERFVAQNARFAEEVKEQKQANSALLRKNETLKQRLVEAGLTDGVDRPAVVAHDIEVADLISSLEERMVQVLACSLALALARRPTQFVPGFGLRAGR